MISYKSPQKDGHLRNRPPVVRVLASQIGPSGCFGGVRFQSLTEVKMGRGSPICERVCKKIVEYFKNNISQRQIAKALQISSSTVHNIIKRFRETGEISVN